MVREYAPLTHHLTTQPMSTNSPNDTDSNPVQSLAKLFTTFSPVDELPIPQTEEEIRNYAEQHPNLDDDADILPDELYCDGLNTIAENAEWMVFRTRLFMSSSDVYMWNKELGEGLRMPVDEWQFGNFAQVISLAHDNHNAWNADEPKAEPDSRYGCPYCDGSESDDLSSSTRPSGSSNQRCTICGRSRTIG